LEWELEWEEARRAKEEGCIQLYISISGAKDSPRRWEETMRFLSPVVEVVT
jgi:hypothetical protein